MDKILITGVDGMLGSNLALALAPQNQVVGLHHPLHTITLPGCTTTPCDISNAEELACCYEEHQPRWLIHCGSLSRSSWDSRIADPIDEQAELSATENLVSLTEARPLQLTALLTDDIFCGPRLFHNEDGPAFAQTPFAALARRAESIFAQCSALVVRTHAYGWSPPTTSPGLCEQIWHAIEQREPPTADQSSHATPILATDLAPLLCHAYRRELRGVYHITGAERTSPLRFAQELSLLSDAAADGIIATSCHADASAPDRREETSLNTRRARRALKLAMPLLCEGLRRWVEQIDNGHRAHLCNAEPPVTAGRAA